MEANLENNDISAVETKDLEATPCKWDENHQECVKTASAKKECAEVRITILDEESTDDKQEDDEEDHDGKEEGDEEVEDQEKEEEG